MPGTSNSRKAQGEEDGEASSFSERTGIRYPGQNDVKFGRGGDTNYHIGNSRFRHFVNRYKPRYQVASKEERQVVVQEIVKAWRSQDPPGRFLARTNSGAASKDAIIWHEVGDEMASKKTAKVLGEGLGSKRKPQEQPGSPPETKRKPPPSCPSPAPLSISDSLASNVAMLPAGREQTSSAVAMGNPQVSIAQLIQAQNQSSPRPQNNSSDTFHRQAAGAGLLLGVARATAATIPRSSTYQHGDSSNPTPASAFVSDQIQQDPQLQTYEGNYLPVAAFLTDVFKSSSDSSHPSDSPDSNKKDR